MRILSQDGDIVAAIGGNGYLNLGGRNVLFTSFGSDYIDLILGTYATEERAKEVLTELFHCQYEGFVMPEV